MPIGATGQPDTDDLGLARRHEPLRAFVARARTLTDGDRAAVAEARSRVDESFHDAALRSAAEALVARSDAYALARRALATAHVPDALAAAADEEARRWTDVARLVQLAIDEALVALVATDVLHPNHLRELYRPWRALPPAPEPADASATSTSSP